MASTRTAAAIFLLAALIGGAVHHHPVVAASVTVDATGELGADGPLSLGFYDESCPILPHIVEYFVKKAFRKDVGLAPGLIRILFHDCFPQGCDASVLLNGTGSEQLEPPNLTLRPVALKLVEDIRAAAHATCGPVVSCADILALATRDALVEAGGPTYALPLGRRDGLEPASQDLVFTLPGPNFTVPMLITSFSDRKLSVTDLVTLSGAHSFGVAHCPGFADRFTPVTDTDPAIDPVFAAKLKAKCALDVPVLTVKQNLDVRTPDKFDNKYYIDLIAKQGLFKSDQGLIVHPTTSRMAIKFALRQGAFFDQFAKSMVKMSGMDMLTGTQGEIRLNCAVPNKKVPDIQTAAAADEDERLAAEM